MRMKLGTVVLSGLSLVLGSGCIVVIADHGCWSDGEARVWITSTEERTIEGSGLSALEVRTHNGAVDFQGQPDGAPASVTVKKKAGGRTDAEAQEAMAAIEVIVEPNGDTTRIGWRWRGIKHRHWSGDVSFEIRAPGSTELDLETHNGAIAVRGATNDVDVETHNGELILEASGKSLSAQTHNGSVKAAFSGASLDLETHNGQIVVDLSGCKSVSGSVTTYNGSVRLAVGTEVSATLQCRTHNGTVDCNVPLNESRQSRGALEGTLGAGGGKLDVVTHNGEIHIDRSSS